ncbi:MAG: GTP-binding protein [Eubacteriales bacterium]|nr:GTP-binding protein [Eubacteriales bacterium]
MEKIPVTLLTGYLGAGKTTLLNHILKHPTGRRIALVVNDLGSVNVDARLLKSNGIKYEKNQLMELTNGCICCSLREDFIKEIKKLALDGRFDSIVVEASGVSSPANIADAFEDEGTEFPARLDAIIAVADANRIHTEFLDALGEHVALNAEEGQEEEQDIINLVMEQMEYSNIIVLNKCDLLTTGQTEKIERLIHSLVPEAEIIETSNGCVEPVSLFDRKLYDYEKMNRASVLARAWSEGESHEDESDYGIKTFCYKRKKPFDGRKFNAWIERRYPGEIIRAKGYLWFVQDEAHMVLFEQAGNSIALTPGARWFVSYPEEERQELLAEYPELLEGWDEINGDKENQIVFIGKGMDIERLIQELDTCLADIS